MNTLIKAFKSEKVFIKIIIALVLMLSILLAADKFYNTIFVSKEKKDMRGSISIVEIKKICEMASIKYEYVDIVSEKSSRYVGKMKIPFSEKGFILKYNGYIKAGVDLNEFKKTGPESCEMKISKPKILEHNYNKKDVYFYNKEESLFNKLDIEEDDIAIAENMKKFEELKGGEIIGKAEKNAKESLTVFMTGLGFKDIKISME